jgi:hypothetical protein
MPGPSIAGILGSPITNNVAIATMSAGCSLPVQDLEGIDFAKC